MPARDRTCRAVRTCCPPPRSRASGRRRCMVNVSFSASCNDHPHRPGEACLRRRCNTRTIGAQHGPQRLLPPAFGTTVPRLDALVVKSSLEAGTVLNRLYAARHRQHRREEEEDEQNRCKHVRTVVGRQIIGTLPRCAFREVSRG